MLPPPPSALPTPPPPHKPSTPLPRSAQVNRASVSSSLSPSRLGLSRPSRLSHGARSRRPTRKLPDAPHSYIRPVLRCRSQRSSAPDWPGSSERDAPIARYYAPRQEEGRGRFWVL